MKLKKLKERVEQLEKEVAELKLRPPYLYYAYFGPYYVPTYIPPIQQPYVIGPSWYTTTAGSTWSSGTITVSS